MSYCLFWSGYILETSRIYLVVPIFTSYHVYVKTKIQSSIWTPFHHNIPHYIKLLFLRKESVESFDGELISWVTFSGNDFCKEVTYFPREKNVFVNSED